MNRTMPPGDCGHRSAAARRSPGRAGALLGALGLVGGAADSAGPAIRKAAGRNAGGLLERMHLSSGADGVVALPVLALGGDDLQAHLLANGAGEEPAHGMRLPAGGRHQSLRSHSARAPQQTEHERRLAAVAGAFGLRGGLGRLLGPGGLLVELAFCGGTSGVCGATGVAVASGCASALACASAWSGSDWRKHWMAFQIRLAAVLRSVNFLTGLTPGRLLWIATSRAVGQLVASLARPASLRKRSAFGTASASCAVGRAVMLSVSFSMVNVIMLGVLLR